MNKTRCLICGMIIGSNSLYINQHSFMEKNSENKILSCPFCGVGISYLDDKKDVYNEKIDNLNEETKKVLEKAMKLEVFNGDFYREASLLAENDEIKQTFKDLSNIEFMHARIHKRLGSFNNLPTLRKIDYKRHDSDKLLLIEANKREQHAIAFYNMNSKIVNSNIIKQVFTALSSVEKGHVIITEERNKELGY
ncbi:ferritin family protein [Sporosalibacterium faouarense]|uniref:ferritin family protein n=1 Tax=Sporosalibacterium faouarense TaxID=516123 RepID=UPI00192B0FF3|nr:ferritin family protein [Sporosalibacterium faouarense]